MDNKEYINLLDCIELCIELFSPEEASKRIVKFIKDDRAIQADKAKCKYELNKTK